MQVPGWSKMLGQAGAKQEGRTWQPEPKKPWWEHLSPSQMFIEVRNDVPELLSWNQEKGRPRNAYHQHRGLGGGPPQQAAWRGLLSTRMC